MTGAWPLAVGIAVFVAAAAAIALGGARLSSIGDTLADRTGWGEAVFGVLLFGGLISISGIVITVVAAARGQESLAYGNAVGGIAAQTAALAVADLFYRKSNLEHAAASLPNMFSAASLIFLLTLGIAASLVPEVTILAVHPASVVLAVVYLYGLHQMRAVHDEPGWVPRKTSDTVADVPSDDQPRQSSRRLWGGFLVLGGLVSISGWGAARGAESILEHTELGAGVVGSILLGVTNALPEMVTSVAAVRRGALTLAVAGVVGGNTFDVLTLVAGDIAYREGSLYHAASRSDLFVGLLAVLMTTGILAGLLRRERSGPGNIGFESVFVLLLYFAGMALVALGS